MADASIPVDLFNPGQVFASLGFLEMADVLLGDAEGGFDWSDEGRAIFRLRARSDQDPFRVALHFLATTQVRRRAPPGYSDPIKKPSKKVSSKKAPSGKKHPKEGRADGTTIAPFDLCETFLSRTPDFTALPIRLVDPPGRSFDVDHWMDGTSRKSFKLYSGNRSAADIAGTMLYGKRAKTRKNQDVSDLLTRGIRTLWEEFQARAAKEPFGLLTPMRGSFNFDPRGGWTGLDAGYSPNDHGHSVASSPIVEMLAAIGLEHARPGVVEHRKVTYAAWEGLAPPQLARPALAGASVGLRLRSFRFDLALSGKNKVVTFAQEE